MCWKSRPGESEDQGPCQGMQLDHTMHRQPGFLFCFCFESLLYDRRWAKTSCVNFSCSQQPPKKSLIVINHIKSV